MLQNLKVSFSPCIGHSMYLQAYTLLIRLKKTGAHSTLLFDWIHNTKNKKREHSENGGVGHVQVLSSFRTWNKLIDPPHKQCPSWYSTQNASSASATSQLYMPHPAPMLMLPFMPMEPRLLP